MDHGEPLKHVVIGLSRGIEIEHKEEEKKEDEKKEEVYEIKHEEHHHQGEGGFGGSDFKTPVDVHHEKPVHLKVLTKNFMSFIMKILQKFFTSHLMYILYEGHFQL